MKRSSIAKSSNLDVVIEKIDVLVEKAKKMSVKDLKTALLEWWSNPEVTLFLG